MYRSCTREFDEDCDAELIENIEGQNEEELLEARELFQDGISDYEDDYLHVSEDEARVLCCDLCQFDSTQFAVNPDCGHIACMKCMQRMMYQTCPFCRIQIKGIIECFPNATLTMKTKKLVDHENRRLQKLNGQNPQTPATRGVPRRQTRQNNPAFFEDEEAQLTDLFFSANEGREQGAQGIGNSDEEWNRRVAQDLQDDYDRDGRFGATSDTVINPFNGHSSNDTDTDDLHRPVQKLTAQSAQHRAAEEERRRQNTQTTQDDQVNQIRSVDVLDQLIEGEHQAHTEDVDRERRLRRIERRRRRELILLTRAVSKYAR